MLEWHESNYDRVREALSDLTPIKNGVPFERVYTEIWHFVFGIANRTLVEEGAVRGSLRRRAPLPRLSTNSLGRRPGTDSLSLREI